MYANQGGCYRIAYAISGEGSLKYYAVCKNSQPPYSHKRGSDVADRHLTVLTWKTILNQTRSYHQDLKSLEGPVTSDLRRLQVDF